MVKAADEAEPDSPGAFGVGCFWLSSAPAHQAPEFAPSSGARHQDDHVWLI